MVLLLNFAVDKAFIYDVTKEKIASLANIESKIEEENQALVNEENIANLRNQIRSEQEIIEQKEREKLPLIEDLNSTKQLHETKKAEISAYRASNGRVQTFFSQHAELDKLDIEEKQIRKNISEIEEKIKSSDQAIRQAKSQIQQHEAAINGDVGLLSKITQKTVTSASSLQNAITKFSESMTIKNIKTQLNDYLDKTTDLIVLFTLKTIVIPLVFFFIVIRGSQAAWRINYKELL